MYSFIPNTGKLRFIEVKGRLADADSITVTRNEVLAALNKPEASSSPSSPSRMMAATKCAMCGNPSPASRISGR